MSHVVESEKRNEEMINFEKIIYEKKARILTTFQTTKSNERLQFNLYVFKKKTSSNLKNLIKKGLKTERNYLNSNLKVNNNRKQSNSATSDKI